MKYKLNNMANNIIEGKAKILSLFLLGLKPI